MVFRFARLLCLRQAQLKSMNCLMWGNKRGKKKSILFTGAVLEFLFGRSSSGLMLKSPWHASCREIKKRNSNICIYWELYPTLAGAWTLWSKAFFIFSAVDPDSGRHTWFWTFLIIQNAFMGALPTTWRAVSNMLANCNPPPQEAQSRQ